MPINIGDLRAPSGTVDIEGHALAGISFSTNVVVEGEGYAGGAVASGTPFNDSFPGVSASFEGTDVEGLITSVDSQAITDVTTLFTFNTPQAFRFEDSNGGRLDFTATVYSARYSVFMNNPLYSDGVILGGITAMGGIGSYNSVSSAVTGTLSVLSAANLSAIHVGTAAVGKVYAGTNLVWMKSAGTYVTTTTTTTGAFVPNPTFSFTGFSSGTDGFVTGADFSGFSDGDAVRISDSGGSVDVIFTTIGAAGGGPLGSTQITFGHLDGVDYSTAPSITGPTFTLLELE